MRPGGWYSRPLLRADARLVETLEADAATLRRAGLAAEALGSRLATLIADAGGTDWFRPLRRADVSIEVRHRRGFLTCPWADQEFRPCPAAPDQPPTADEFVLRHRAARIEIASFVLIAHLIRHHGCFGGVGTPIRVEPETLAKALAQPPR